MSEDYFQEIEAHFAERRGTPFVVNPKDWALMKEWQAEGIPLAVVIEALDSVFDKAAEKSKKVNSLHYCRHAVKELWAERRDLSIGSGEDVPEADSAAILTMLAAELEASSAPREVLEPIVTQVRELRGSVPVIEEKLMELEASLINDSLARIDTDAIRAEIARALGDTSRLDEKTRARTEEANLRRIVRERLGLPRMTLFR